MKRLPRMSAIHLINSFNRLLISKRHRTVGEQYSASLLAFLVCDSLRMSYNNNRPIVQWKRLLYLSVLVPVRMNGWGTRRRRLLTPVTSYNFVSVGARRCFLSANTRKLRQTLKKHNNRDASVRAKERKYSLAPLWRVMWST